MEERRQAKRARTSKTIWFNMAMAVLGTLQVNSDFFTTAFADNKTVLIIFAVLVPVGNIILRFMTNQPMTKIKLIKLGKFGKEKDTNSDSEKGEKPGKPDNPDA